jgi:thiol-disulfide isomerase/thioredoxin
MSDPDLATTDAPSAGDTARRRRRVVGAVAAAAALAGVGLAWQQKNSASSRNTQPELWKLSFDTPAGPALHMQTFAGKPLLVNFWATWCPPCIEEFPLLDRFYVENAGNGWQVVGLAVDQPAPVEAFLRHVPVRFPIAMAGMAGIELSRTMGNLGGGLPFTLVLGSNGQVLHRKMGRISPNDLLQWSALR